MNDNMAQLQSIPGDRNRFTAVKIFSATMAPDRANLGDKISNWIGANPDVEIVDTVVTQSSDEAFHCLAITVFYRRNARPAA